MSYENSEINYLNSYNSSGRNRVQPFRGAYNNSRGRHPGRGGYNNRGGGYKNRGGYNSRGRNKYNRNQQFTNVDRRFLDTIYNQYDNSPTYDEFQSTRLRSTKHSTDKYPLPQQQLLGLEDNNNKSLAQYNISESQYYHNRTKISHSNKPSIVFPTYYTSQRGTPVSSLRRYDREDQTTKTIINQVLKMNDSIQLKCRKLKQQAIVRFYSFYIFFIYLLLFIFLIFFIIYCLYSNYMNKWNKIQIKIY